MAPQKLPPNQPATYSTTGIELYEGVEHVVALDASTRTVLLPLPEGAPLTISRPAECEVLTLYLGQSSYPVRCRTAEGVHVFRSLVANGDGTLSPTDGQPVTYPAEMQIHSFGFPTWDTELVQSPDAVYELDPATSGLTELVPLEGRTLTTTIRKNGEWGPGFAATSTDAEGVHHWTAPATPQAEWTKLGTLPVAAVLLPIGGAWYGHTNEEPNRTRVWRFENGVALDLGTSEHFPSTVSYLVESTGVNDRAVLGCDERLHCTLYEVGLEPPSLEPRTIIEMPTEDRLYVVAQRELACSSVEAFIATLHEQIGQWLTPAHYWTRVVPR